MGTLQSKGHTNRTSQSQKASAVIRCSDGPYTLREEISQNHHLYSLIEQCIGLSSAWPIPLRLCTHTAQQEPNRPPTLSALCKVTILNSIKNSKDGNARGRLAIIIRQSSYSPDDITYTCSKEYDYQNDDSEKLIAIDLGLYSTVSRRSTRITTLTSCTYGFPSSWGLPCRHMLLVHHQQRLTDVPCNPIADFWRAKSREDNGYVLYNFICNDNIIQNIRIVETDSNISKDERYAIMTTEFKNIAYIASFDQSSYNMVKEKLADIYHLLAVDHSEAQIAHKTTSNITKVKNPRHVKSKGRPPNKRKRIFTEMKQKRKDNLTKIVNLIDLVS
ncbi:hypothetical protein LOD99_7882 [Oopsacas minuta]|uniref:SWIM-type domain-containing protein n=1 Tax=Oopsacas minuta TaxID=111878 RepID=A0AAV7JR46_9METZ|nr:hypothetical protein LOD99_7882 [Oopsacas minuta]